MTEMFRGTVRAISTRTGKFVYGSPCVVGGHEQDSIIVNTGTHEAPVFELEPVLPTTRGMFATTDSLENPVFEHDIIWIRCSMKSKFGHRLYKGCEHGIIKYLDWLEQMCVCFGCDSSIRLLNIKQHVEFEVVGNLFDNPILARWALNHTPVCLGKDGLPIYDGDIIRQNGDDPGCLVLWNSQKMDYIAITTTGERFPLNTIAGKYYSVGNFRDCKDRDSWKPDQYEKISWNMPQEKKKSIYDLINNEYRSRSKKPSEV